MTDEERAAAELIERHGAQARDAAQRRAEDCASRGDWREHDAALRLLTAVEKALRRQPGRRSRAASVDPEVLALQALAHIAADERLLERFVTVTGCGLDALRARAGEPAFLGAVLDFLLDDEPAVVAFAAAAGVDAEAVLRARARLPGAHADW